MGTEAGLCFPTHMVGPVNRGMMVQALSFFATINWGKIRQKAEDLAVVDLIPHGYSSFLLRLEECPDQQLVDSVPIYLGVEVAHPKQTAERLKAWAEVRELHITTQELPSGRILITIPEVLRFGLSVHPFTHRDTIFD